MLCLILQDMLAKWISPANIDVLCHPLKGTILDTQMYAHAHSWNLNFDTTCTCIQRFDKEDHWNQKELNQDLQIWLLHDFFAVSFSNRSKEIFSPPFCLKLQFVSPISGLLEISWDCLVRNPQTLYLSLAKKIEYQYRRPTMLLFCNDTCTFLMGSLMRNQAIDRLSIGYQIIIQGCHFLKCPVHTCLGLIFELLSCIMSAECMAATQMRCWLHTYLLYLWLTHRHGHRHRRSNWLSDRHTWYFPLCPYSSIMCLSLILLLFIL